MNEENKSRKESDIIGIVLLLWSKRKRIIINCFIGGVLAIIVAFSIPKQYTSTVVLAPELADGSSISGGLGALASMAGINMGGMMGSEALHPELYPQIVSSTPFMLELLSLEVESEDKEIKATLYDYLVSHQRRPWWTAIVVYPKRWLGLTDTEKDGHGASVDGTGMKLTRKQQKVISGLNKKVVVSVDKGNFVITLNVTMQDPKIAAVVANEVSLKLQKYIADYRSAKARKDFEYAEQIYNESQDKYHRAQQEYALFMTQHQNITNMKSKAEEERLMNEKDLAFTVYNQLSQNLEMARAKVQEQTPVCVEMQPAMIPIKASSPKKIMMGLLYLFLAFFGTTAWILLKDRILNR